MHIEEMRRNETKRNETKRNEIRLFRLSSVRFVSFRFVSFRFVRKPVASMCIAVSHRFATSRAVSRHFASVRGSEHVQNFGHTARNNLTFPSLTQPMKDK